MIHCCYGCKPLPDDSGKHEVDSASGSIHSIYQNISLCEIILEL